MPGVISVRFDKDERAKLHQWVQERGATSISELIRSQFGFRPRPHAEPLLEEIDNASVLPLLVSLIEQLKAVERVTARVAHQVGVPRDEVRAARLGEAAAYDGLPTDAPSVKHPALPEGFQR